MVDRPPRSSGRAPQLGDRLLQRLAVDVLHRVVVDALLLPDGEHRHDVRMVQLGRRLRFVAEAGDLPLIEHRGERQDLERHAPVERLLVRLVDDAHAAAADLAHDPVVADLPAARFVAPPWHAVRAVGGRSAGPHVARRAVQQPQAVEIRPQLVGQIRMRGQQRVLIRRNALLQSAR